MGIPPVTSPTLRDVNTVSAIALKPAAGRNAVEKDVLRWYSLEHAANPDVRDAWKRLNELQREKEKLERLGPAMEAALQTLRVNAIVATLSYRDTYR